jgi:hypothetical protein
VAGSFHQIHTRDFVFARTVNGVQLSIKIGSFNGFSRMDGKNYSFRIGGSGAADLPTVNPVAVRLTICRIAAAPP